MENLLRAIYMSAPSGRVSGDVRGILFHALASMGSPVWLEGDAVITCHLAEVLLQLSEELLVAFSLIQRHEGVNVGELPPGDGLQEEGTAVKRWLLLSHATGSHFRVGMRGI